MVRRLLTATLLAGAALATTGAAPPEEQAMLDAFDRVLTAMAYAASGLCLFAIVWAGFVLMAEGAEEGESECVPRTLETIQLQTVAGHASVTETALMDAAVTAITGTVNVGVGGSHTSVPFVAGGETRFRVAGAAARPRAPSRWPSSAWCWSFWPRRSPRCCAAASWTSRPPSAKEKTELKKPNDRIKTPGAEGPPDGAAAPQDISTEPQAPAPKPPPPLPPFFMLSHLEEDGPVRLDGVKLGVCEVMGLEIDEPKLGAFAGALNACDFPVQLLIRQHPPRLGGLREELREAQPQDLPPQTRAGGRVASQALDRPGSPRRHPRPALLRRVRVRAV